MGPAGTLTHSHDSLLLQSGLHRDRRVDPDLFVTKRSTNVTETIANSIFENYFGVTYFES